MREYKVNYGVATTLSRLNKENNGLQSVFRCFAGDITVESEHNFSECQKTVQHLANESVKKYDEISDFLCYIFEHIDDNNFTIIDANVTYANERTYELKGLNYSDKNLLGTYAPTPTYEDEINNQIMLLNGGDSLSHLSTEEKVEIIKLVTGKDPVTQNPAPKKKD